MSSRGIVPVPRSWEQVHLLQWHLGPEWKHVQVSCGPQARVSGALLTWRKDAAAAWPWWRGCHGGLVPGAGGSNSMFWGRWAMSQLRLEGAVVEHRRHIPGKGELNLQVRTRGQSSSSMALVMMCQSPDQGPRERYTAAVLGLGNEGAKLQPGIPGGAQNISFSPVHDKVLWLFYSQRGDRAVTRAPGGRSHCSNSSLVG